MNNSIFNIKRVPKSGLILLLFLFSSQYLKAQAIHERVSNRQYVSHKWDNTRGLPVNTVFSLTKDSTGYLWAATEEGLVRFDGVNFRTFNQDNVEGLTSPMFNDLEKSSKGGVWAANVNSIVHAKENELTIFDARSEVAGSRFTSLAEDQHGRVWAGTNDGDLLVLSDGQLRFVQGWSKEMGESILVIEKYSKGILIGTRNGLFKFRNDSGTIEPVPEYEGIEIRALAEAKNGSLWIGTKDRGIYYHTQDVVIIIDEYVGLVHNQVNTLRLDNEGRVWAGMSVGGVQIISDTEIVTLREIEFGYNEVNEIFIDDTETVWLTSVGHGIIHMIPSDIRMLQTEDGLSDNIALAIYQDSTGVVWSGTAGAGLNRIENGEISHITSESGLGHGVVLGIYGVDDKIYIGTGRGLYRYNPAVNSVDRTFSAEDGLASNIVQAIYQDSRRQVWITTRSGGIHLLHDHSELEQIEVPQDFQNAEFISILEDSQGNMWFSTTSNGILKINSEGVQTGYSIHPGPSSEMVLSLYEDPEGSIWAGTNEGMLVLKEGGEFKVINRSNGLQFNGIFRMIEDDYGYLWASGNFGIQRIRLDDLMELKHDDTGELSISVRLFDTSDGMANHETNGSVFPAGWKMDDGEIWFPTMQGIARISPQILSELETAPAAYISSLRYGNNEFSSLDEISIPPGVHNLEIHYGSFEYKKPHTINYTYRIEAIDKEWRQTGNRNTVYFTSLAPGNYTFEVKAEQFGLESEIDSISFRIEPFFYQTNVFRLLILLGLFTAGYLVRDYYSKHQLGKQMKKQVEEQTMELQKRNRTLEKALSEIENQNRVLKKVSWVQSHELRGPLSRLLGLIDVVSNYDRFSSIKKDKAELLGDINTAANELDNIIRKINADIEKFDKSGVIQ